MTSETAFWDRVSASYAKRPVSDPDSYEKKLAMTREYFGADSRILEVGCGTGSTAIRHARYAGEIIATDLSSAMLEIARDKAAAAGVANVTFRQAAIESIDETPGSFDVVMAHSLLHLLKDPAAGLRIIFRMLKPGGVFVSSTMCLGDSYRWLRWIGPVGRLMRVLPRIRTFTASELRESIEDAGFLIEKEWRPGPKKASFVIARRPVEGAP